MPNTRRTTSVRGMHLPWATILHVVLLATLIAVAPISGLDTVAAHEGHEHDKPPPLNLPVAPRVVAVTPDYELVGVLSGEHRLTIFLHRFETGEPIKGAKLSVSAGEQEVDAAAKENGVFEVSAPWITAAEAIDLVFSLTLPNDQDILTGRLDKAAAASAPAKPLPTSISQHQQTLYVGAGALMAGVLLTLLISARIARRRQPLSGEESQVDVQADPKPDSSAKVKQLRRAPIAILVFLLALTLREEPLLPCSRARGQTDDPCRDPQPTGWPHTWLNPAGIADFDGDGWLDTA